jgi:hypothetical protein
MMVDIRIWRSERAAQDGAESETGRGLSLAIELLPNLVKALSAAMRAAGLDDQGLEVREGQNGRI